MIMNFYLVVVLLALLSVSDSYLTVRSTDSQLINVSFVEGVPICDLNSPCVQGIVTGVWCSIRFFNDTTVTTQKSFCLLTNVTGSYFVEKNVVVPTYHNYSLRRLGVNYVSLSEDGSVLSPSSFDDRYIAKVCPIKSSNFSGKFSSPDDFSFFCSEDWDIYPYHMCVRAFYSLFPLLTAGTLPLDDSFCFVTPQFNLVTGLDSGYFQWTNSLGTGGFEPLVPSFDWELTRLDVYQIGGVFGIPTANVTRLNTKIPIFPDLRFRRVAGPFVFIQSGTSVFINTEDYDNNLYRLVYVADNDASCTTSLSLNERIAHSWYFTSTGGGTLEFPFDDAFPGVRDVLVSLCCQDVCSYTTVIYDRSPEGCKTGSEDLKSFLCYYDKNWEAWFLTFLVIIIIAGVSAYAHKKGKLIPFIYFISTPLRWLFRLSQLPCRRVYARYYGKKRPEHKAWKALLFYAYLFSSYPWLVRGFENFTSSNSPIFTPIGSLSVNFDGCDSGFKAELINSLKKFDMLGYQPLPLGGGSIPTCTMASDGSVNSCVLENTFSFSMNLIAGSVTSYMIRNLSVPGSVLPSGQPGVFAVEPLVYGMYYRGLKESVSTTYLYTHALDFSLDQFSWSYADADSPEDHAIAYDWCKNYQCNFQSFDCSYHPSWYHDGSVCGFYPYGSFHYANGAQLIPRFVSKYVYWPDSDYFMDGDIKDDKSTCNVLLYNLANWTNQNFAHVYAVNPVPIMTHQYALFKRNTTAISFTCASQDATVMAKTNVDLTTSFSIGVSPLPESATVGLGDNKIIISEGDLGYKSRYGGDFTAIVGPAADRGYGMHTGPGMLQYFGYPLPFTYSLPRVLSASPCSNNDLTGATSCWQQTWDYRSYGAAPYRDLIEYISGFGQVLTPAPVMQTDSFSIAAVDCIAYDDTTVTVSNNVSYPAFSFQLLHPVGPTSIVTVKTSLSLTIVNNNVDPKYGGPPRVTGMVGQDLYSHICVNITSSTTAGTTILSVDPPVDGGSAACFVPINSYFPCCIVAHLGQEQGFLRVIASAGSGLEVPSLYTNFTVGIDSSTPTFSTWSKSRSDSGATGNSDGSWDIGTPSGFAGWIPWPSSLFGLAGSHILAGFLNAIIIFIMPFLVIYVIFKLIMNMLSKRRTQSEIGIRYSPLINERVSRTPQELRRRR